MSPSTRARVEAALASVPDPEIPACSILDLGMLHEIVNGDDALRVVLLPTFAGCPALEAISADAMAALERAFGDRRVEVHFSFETPWTTDRITPRGRAAMQTIGVAPPGPHVVPITLGRPSERSAGPCPYCSSEETEATSAFGPTPCRAVAYCRGCRNPFEPFKRKGA